jgi:hypothetical protein
MKREAKGRREFNETPHAESTRRQFVYDIARCMICGSCTGGGDVHEIARGPSRKEAYHNRAAWLLLCRQCHDEVGNYMLWPIARQLAVKLVADPDYFDLEVVNRLRGRDKDAITMQEVKEEILFLPRSVVKWTRPTRVDGV